MEVEWTVDEDDGAGESESLYATRNFPTESKMATARVYIFYFVSHTACHASTLHLCCS